MGLAADFLGGIDRAGLAGLAREARQDLSRSDADREKRRGSSGKSYAASTDDQGLAGLVGRHAG